MDSQTLSDPLGSTVPSAVLVGIVRSRSSRREAEEGIQELSQLASAAGMVPMATFLQEKEVPDAAFLIGRGKAQEIAVYLQSHGNSSVIFDEDLAPHQQRNLEDLWGCRVIDRTILVLDIFAQRARTREGKLQVELAQLSYLLPRLTGKGTLLSRLGGGIGTRGPGETKLEMDRRRIRHRIALLRRELEKVRLRRTIQREPRRKIPAAMVAIVGYTNAGKSTLFNALCRSDSLVSPKMFSTLDPTVRGLDLPDGRRLLFSDTVGFLRKLPHHLVAAFHATLEEVVQADLLLHVIDSTAENLPEQIQAVEQVLDDIGCQGKNKIYVFNKIDLLEAPVLERLGPRYKGFSLTQEISALQKTGLSALIQAVAEQLQDRRRRILVQLPYSESALRSMIHARGQVIRESFQEGGTIIEVVIDSGFISRLAAYQISDRQSEPCSSGTAH